MHEKTRRKGKMSVSMAFHYDHLLPLPFWITLSLILFFNSITSSHQQSLLTESNPRLSKAYTTLQAWKHTVSSDPNNFTSNWVGPNVCNYTGIYCAPPPDDPLTITVAGIDLNHGDVAGSLPEELGLLTDLALLHINSNQFSGSLPNGIRLLRLLFELDVSNNQFSGPFPEAVLDLPSLKFLDIRYNGFQGDVPPALFDLKLDAIFINNNEFHFSIPENLGNSTASVIVLANNNISGCLPSSISKMKDTLNEIIILNGGLSGCLPEEIGSLVNVTVFDVSFNGLVGALPEPMGGMKSLKELNVAYNKFSGAIPGSVCSLPGLENFTYSFNYFSGEPLVCLKLPGRDDRKNCIPERPEQRSPGECEPNGPPADCSAFRCS